MPPFRLDFYSHAFGEGWGLYSEKLGEEMGIYKTPYDHFGRLSYEMWRACRLVVDTGMHALGWSRERALQYLADNTALSDQEVRTETDRYIANPGQALAYKMGELKLWELRARAQQALGERFDVRAFHDAVMANGALPLPVLERQIDEYIAGANGRLRHRLTDWPIRRRTRPRPRPAPSAASLSPRRGPRTPPASAATPSACDLTMYTAISTPGMPPSVSPSAAGAVAARAHEALAADRHQEGARTHHDRKGRQRVHAEQAHEHEAGRVQPDAQHHQGAQQETDGDREHQATAVQAQRRHRRRAANWYSWRRTGRRPRAAPRPCPAGSPGAAAATTTPTPSQAPTTAAAIMVTSVVTSTVTAEMNTSASTTTGSE